MIALIGEAWGEEEEKVRLPFVGKAGQQLDKLLHAAGIKREACYLTNVFHERPKNNDFGVYYEDKSRKKPKECLIEAHDRLKLELVEKNVKLAVCLGNEPFYALTGQKGVEAWRGSVLPAPWDAGIKVLPTFHPSAVLRVGGENVWYVPAVVKDLKRAQAMIDQPAPNMPKITLCESVSQFASYLESAKGSLVGVDIEVMYKYAGESLASIAFSHEKGSAFVIPFIREFEEEEVVQLKTKTKVKKVWKSAYYFPDESVRFELLGLIKTFFESADWLKVGQNFQFDVNTLRRLGVIDRCVGFAFDTLVAHSNSIQPEFPHDLGFLCSWYTLYPHYKFMIESRNEDFWKYNGYDAAVTRECVEPMTREMEQNGMLDFYETMVHPTFPCVSEMNFAGIRIDRDYQKQLRHDLQEQIDQESAGLAEETDGIITNHKSSPQCLKYFYEHKGYTPFKKKVKKDGGYEMRPTTDENALKKIVKKYSDPVAAKMMMLREKQKMLSSYANMKTDERGIVRTTYLYAKTGRFRSGADQE